MNKLSTISIDSLNDYCIGQYSLISYSINHDMVLSADGSRLTGLHPKQVSFVQGALRSLQNHVDYVRWYERKTTFVALCPFELEKGQLTGRLIKITPIQYNLSEQTVDFLLLTCHSPYSMGNSYWGLLANYEKSELFCFTSESSKWEKMEVTPLTDQEKILLKFGFSGCTEKEIGSCLCWSHAKVKQIKNGLFKKLRVHKLSQAALLNEILRIDNLYNNIP